MRYAKDRKAQTRQKIVVEAGKLFRRQGYSAVGVDAVMAAAGLTPGGFYSHFASKEALFAEALELCSIENLIDKAPPSADPLSHFITNYLSEAHVLHPERGCPLPPLAAEVSRQSTTVRESFTTILTERMKGLARLMPGADPAEQLQNAFLLIASLGGTVLMTRALEDPALRRSLLSSAKESLIRQWVERQP